MQMKFQLNLILGWLWILLSFGFGFVLGLFFHDEKWLGGYASFRRRLYRLAHISFFGLGTVNLLFYFTSVGRPITWPWTAASILFALGALTMPVCCMLMAHVPKSRVTFAIPVTSLVSGGILTLVQLIKP